MSNTPNWKTRAEQAQKAVAGASQRNTELLERISGLRVALAAVMRRSYPAHVTGVEKSLGGHLSDLPDSVLLGYLEAFSLMSSTGKVSTPNDLREISRALRDSGFPMEDDATALDMAVAIRGGFKAAKYDNSKLRKEARQGKSKGAAAIQRDLSWAEAGTTTQPERPAKREQPRAQQEKPKQRRPKQQLTINTPPPADVPTNAAPAPEPVPQKFEELEGSLLVAAPRFMQEVVNVLGDAATAAEWEEFQKGRGNWSFIPPQGKHRQRGALLIPKDGIRGSISEFEKSPWGRAVAEGYKAGRLYDIAVVLAKLGENIVVCGYSKHVVEVTYRNKGELCTLILGLEAGADPWLGVEEAVGRYSTDDGTASVQDILVVPCPARSAEAVMGTLKAAKSANSWRINSPVRVQEMADWVTNDGRGAELVTAS